MKSRSLIYTFGLLVTGGLVGWSLGPTPNETGDTESSGKSSSAKSTRTVGSSPRSGGRAMNNPQMQAIQNAPDEDSRVRAAIELAKTLPLDQAGKWLDEGLFNQRRGYALTLFTKILEQRWLAEDPDGYFVWQLGNGKSISQENMASLAERNPDFLLAELKLVENPNLLGQALASLARAKPELLLSEIAHMDLGKLKSSGYLQYIFKEIGSKDLAGLQAAFDTLPPPMQEAAQKAIFHKRLQTDFAGTLSELVNLPNGLGIFRNSNLQGASQKKLLENFANLPESWKRDLASNSHLLTRGMNASEILSTDWGTYGLSEGQYASIRGQALFSAVRSNKEGALELFQNTDLSEKGRRNFLDMLHWNNGGDILQEILPHLEASDSEYITKKIGDSPPASGTVLSGEINTAADLSERLAATDGQGLTNLASHMRRWDDEQKAQFQTDYADMQGEERHRATAMLVGAQDLDTRASAINELLGSREAQSIAGWDQDHRTAVRTTSGVAIALLKNDSDRAANWVTGLPAGETRTWAAKNLALNWRNHDPVGAENFVNSLPGSERKAVATFLKQYRN